MHKPVMDDDPAIVWHPGQVSREARRQRFGHRGGTVWFTGLSGSGKSTIAVALEHRLVNDGRHAYRLDGDNIRHGLCRDLGFSPEDRRENVRRVGEVARLFADAGLVTLVSFISPYRADRAHAKQLHEEAGLPFLEVFVHASIATCERRDPKGLYAKARAGAIRSFTGIDAPYEEPEAPDLRLDTEAVSVQVGVEACLQMLRERLWL